ncbi:MAG: hypothetical protein ABID79_05615 [Elusimicrobiota bacterium]
MMVVLGGIVVVLVGVILLFGGPLFCLPVYMWDDFLVCFKGALSSGLVLGGILAVIAGISAIKDKKKAKSEGNN